DVAAALTPFCNVGKDLGPIAARLSIRRILDRSVVRGLAAGLVLALAGLLFYFTRAKQETPAAALSAVRAQFDDPKIERGRGRESILKLRMDFPGSEEAQQAARLMMQLASPFDNLDPERISATQKLERQPKELVAVFGKKGLAALNCVAISPDGRWV